MAGRSPGRLTANPPVTSSTSVMVSRRKAASEATRWRASASIPTTARVANGSITPTVSYAGEPQFSPVEGTNLAYAANTNDTVLKVGDAYFLLQDGVWFVGQSPAGPWQVAREVPEEIYRIPPSSPLYNVTYVRVYQTEPEAVWYSYTTGTLRVSGLGNLPLRNGVELLSVLVQLAGIRLSDLLPPAHTWGVGAYYNPIRGTYGRYGYAYGPYRGIAGARAWNPATGAYARAGAAWGPRGTAGSSAPTIRVAAVALTPPADRAFTAPGDPRA